MRARGEVKNMFQGDDTLIEHLPEEALRQTAGVLALESCPRRLDHVYNLANVDEIEVLTLTVSPHTHVMKREFHFRRT